MVQYWMSVQVETDGSLWYGITAYGGETAWAESLSRSREDVCRLTNELNKGQASLLHFSEIIDDFLADDRR